MLGRGTVQQPGVGHVDECPAAAARARARVGQCVVHHAIGLGGRAGPDRGDRQDMVRRGDAGTEPGVDLVQQPGNIAPAHREQAHPRQQARHWDELLTPFLLLVLLLHQPGHLGEIGVADQYHSAHVEVIEGTVVEKLLPEVFFPECLSDQVELNFQLGERALTRRLRRFHLQTFVVIRGRRPCPCSPAGMAEILGLCPPIVAWTTGMAGFNISLWLAARAPARAPAPAGFLTCWRWRPPALARPWPKHTRSWPRAPPPTKPPLRTRRSA